MQRTRIAMMVLALVLATTQPARPDYDAGQRAWDDARPDEALTQWRAAANEGDRRAMLALGRLYLRGLGVLQDYIEAHKWFNLAAGRGEAAALKERDALAAKMTPEQMATAQERAAAWRPGAGRADGTPDAADERATAAATTQASTAGRRPASSAGDSRGAGVAARPGLPARTGRRHLGPTHRRSLPGVSARRRPAGGRNADAASAARDARDCVNAKGGCRGSRARRGRRRRCGAGALRNERSPSGRPASGGTGGRRRRPEGGARGRTWTWTRVTHGAGRR